MLDLKYRPLFFKDVLGQQKIRAVLQSRLTNDSMYDTSYIFSGPHGSGKTTLARIFARAMLCQNRQKDGEPCNSCESCTNFLNENHFNFEERDAAGHGTIDWVRSTVDSISFSLFGGKKIILFDESHRMSRDSQDVLLKPLEDRDLIAIFCTTEIKKMRPAIRSRCESLQLEKIVSKDTTNRLEHICQEEGFEYNFEALSWIVDHSQGHVRDAINSLDQVSKVGVISTDNVKEYLGVGWSTEILTLIDHILSDEESKALSLLQKLFFKLSPQDIFSNIVDNLVYLQYLNRRLYVPTYFDLNLGVDILGRFDIELVRRCMTQFNRSLRYLDRAMLTCEVMLTMEKLHRGFIERPETVTSKPISKKNPLPTATAKENKEYLTPVDYAGINPAKRDLPERAIKKVSVDTRDVSMTPNTFRKKLLSELS